MLGQIINGLVSGGMYALIAVSFALILGVLDRLNLAHPEVFMVGGFAGSVGFGMSASLWFVGPAVFLVGGCLGLVVERVSFRRSSGQDALVAGALSSFAFGMVLDDLIDKLFGSEPIGIVVPGLVLSGGVGLGGINVSWLQILILATSMLLAFALHIVIHHTSIGRNIRAVADSPVAASLLGVDTRKVVMQVFFISSGLAALAGLLLAIRLGFASAEAGLTFGLKTVAVIAIGGMGDFRGAVLGGLLIGVLEALSFQVGLGRLSELVAWATMITALLAAPQGLFGRTHRRRA